MPEANTAPADHAARRWHDEGCRARRGGSAERQLLCFLTRDENFVQLQVPSRRGDAESDRPRRREHAKVHAYMVREGAAATTLVTISSPAAHRDGLRPRRSFQPHRRCCPSATKAHGQCLARASTRRIERARRRHRRAVLTHVERALDRRLTEAAEARASRAKRERRDGRLTLSTATPRAVLKGEQAVLTVLTISLAKHQSAYPYGQRG